MAIVLWLYHNLKLSIRRNTAAWVLLGTFTAIIMWIGAFLSGSDLLFLLGCLVLDAAWLPEIRLVGAAIAEMFEDIRENYRLFLLVDLPDYKKKKRGDE
jgi:hypothetical protein